MASMDKVNRYLEPGSRSSKLYQRALKVMPGGNSRQTVFTPPYPMYVDHAYGCRVVDVEGQERIDFINNLTSIIVGHCNPVVMDAVATQIRKASAVAWPTESEVSLAEIIASRVPSVEHIRFTNSGTEAVMTAIKGARAFTGKSKIAKFEGCYHGAYEYVEVSLDPTPEAAGDPKAPNSVPYSPGASPSILQDVVVLPFNDLEATEALLEKNRGSIAAVIVDPMPNRLGLVPARQGFLPALREITRRYAMLLIADEVITFRLGYSGTQDYFGFRADMTTFGKVIGGGYPVGAVGGSAEVMSVFDPRAGKPKAPHYGTFNANPVTMVAGAAALEQMTPDAYEYLNSLGAAARSKLTRVFAETGFEAQVTGAGSLFRIILKTGALSDYRSTLVSAQKKSLAREMCLGLLARGVCLADTLLGCTSMPMTMKEIDLLTEAVADWIGSSRRA